MILEGQKHTLQRGGLVGERQYGIALSPKIYSMMSDKLYNDRIGSVVREVCSNAWDAQKMRSLAEGLPMVAFKVTLPTDLEPHFVVEDSGPGMPDEVAQDLYSTLGLSTKENSNDQIGAFGLGSKSPFAVTDTFTVENTYQGITYFYLCMKSETGLPGLLATGSRDEGRKDGVKVIIPAPGSSYGEYKRALNKQLVMMEPKPIVTNADSFSFIVPDKTVVNEFGYTLSNSAEFGLRNASVYARMGMVLYPVDDYQVSYANNVHRSMKRSAIVLEFGIGDIEPVPSREGLTYDAKTKKAISERYAEYAVDYIQQLIDEVKSYTNPLKAWNRAQAIQTDTSINVLNRKDPIIINGIDITNSNPDNIFPKFSFEYEVEVEDPFDETAPKIKEKRKETAPKYQIRSISGRNAINRKNRSDMQNLTYLSFSTLNAILAGNQKYLLMDEINPKFLLPRLKAAVNGVNTYTQQLILVEHHPAYKGDKSDFSDWYAALDSITPVTQTPNAIRLFSSVPKPERDKSQRAKTIDGISYIKYNDSPYERYKTWGDLSEILFDEIEADEDDEDGEPTLVKTGAEKEMFYVTAFRNNLELYGMETKNFSKLMKEYHIVYVRKSGLHNIPKLEELGIKEFKAFISAKMTEFSPSDDYKKRNSAKNLMEIHQGEWFGPAVKYHIPLLVKSLDKEEYPVHDFLNLHNTIVRLSTSAITDSHKENEIIEMLKKQKLMKFFAGEEWTKLLEIDLTEEYQTKKNDIIQQYPLALHLLSTIPVPLSSVYNNDSIVRYFKDYAHINGYVTPIKVIEIDDDIPF